jgi:nitrite reductase/ring-hydroxylating ferredoxin subunit
MKLVHVGTHRVLLIRTSEGVSALDSACPHQGYGLRQGVLAGSTLTCAWHNWKFDVRSGACIQGEEDVVAHRVEIDHLGNVFVELVERDGPSEIPRITTSLRRGLQQNYVGQMARDTVRLLQLSANPGELIWQAVAHAAPRGEFGWGHSIAVAADALTLVDQFDGLERALPIVTALAGATEESLGEPIAELPEPAGDIPVDAANVFRNLIEQEDVRGAQALLLGALGNEASASEIRPWFVTAIADHHLSYGHGAIYVHKAFQLLERLGWERAEFVLPHLVTGLVSGTREDLLPYMKPFNTVVRQFDPFAIRLRHADSSWDPTDLRLALLDSDDRQSPAMLTVDAFQQGATIDSILDVVVDVASQRMLRYDITGEDDLSDDFNWLDITHALTYANATRWLHRVGRDSLDTSHGDRMYADLVRLTLWTVFLAHWTGRHEWHSNVGTFDTAPRLSSADLATAGRQLQRDALLDPGSAFIVKAHAIKTAVAATEEAVRMNSDTPLRAAARFVQEPHRQRFVASAVQESIDFLSGKVSR